MGRPDIPIAIGVEDPLDPAGNAFPDSWRDSADQFWFVDLPPSAGELSDLSGPDLIASVIDAYPGEVFVLVTGAQTDLALALQNDPSLEEKIFVVALMGGAVFTGGNLYEGWEGHPNKVSEFNIWVDPLAASQVLETELRIRMIPLDATGDVVVDSAFTSRLEGLDAPGVDIAAGLWEDEFEGFGVDSVYVWDLLAGVSITHPEFFEWEYDAIDVVTQSGDTHGQTIATGMGSETTWIAAAADAEAILDHVYSIFAGEE
jgi:inosine-uridine nucleoside N-ribohydrolase